MEIFNSLKRINKYLKGYYGIGLFRDDFLRGALRTAIKKFGNKRVDVIEIGTYKGINAREILKRLNINQLILIDTWDNYLGYKEFRGESLKKVYKDAINLLKKSKNFSKIKVIKNYSEKSLKELVPRKFDFIYLDGNHDYQYVKKDLELSWPLLRKGGILGGHDIDFTGVLQAVSEFAIKNKLKLNAQQRDWWIEKNN